MWTELIQSDAYSINMLIIKYNFIFYYNYEEICLNKIRQGNDIKNRILRNDPAMAMI